MNARANFFLMSSNMWKQFSSTVTSDYYMTKYHNILNALSTFFLSQDVGSCTEGGAHQTRWPRGGLDPIPLCYRGLHLFSDIYHTVKSDVALVEEVAPHSESPKPISGQRKERGPESIWLPLPSSACVFHLATGILRRCTAPFSRAPHSSTHDVIEVRSLQAADDAEQK